MLQLINRILGKRGFTIQTKEDAEHQKELINRLEELENQVMESSEKLELAKTSFLKNIYHELRTPLNSIVGFTNLLNRDKLLQEIEKEEYVNLINQGSRNFLRIVDDLIQASLLEAGMVNLNLERCNLSTFFSENKSFFSVRKHISEKNNVALLLSVDDDLKDLDIVCDKFRLTQVLSHLIDNALKNTEKGIVEYGCCTKDNNLEFFVKDSSIRDLTGQDKLVFEKFLKINENSTDDRVDGIGIGLYICKNLVHLMGGNIWFEANKPSGNSGNTFFFTIPLSGSSSLQADSFNDVEPENDTLLKRRKGSIAI